MTVQTRRTAKRRTPERQLNNPDAGFSLLEAILSIAILAVITVPMLTYFTDSARYNAKMKTKQEATLLAQEIVEDLKGEKEPLIREDGSSVYTVPYLVGNGYTADVSGVAQSGDDAGTGKAVLTKTDGNFDIAVTLDTDVPANELVRSNIYGIDSATDVLAVDGAQTDLAVAYFSAKNQSAALSGTSGVSVWTEEELLSRMTRVIKIDIGTAADAESNLCYTVKVTAEYTCGADVLGTAETYTAPTPLLDTTVTELKNLYLLYEKLSNTTAGGSATSDKVEITWGSGVPDTCLPTLYFICQKQDDASLRNSAYRLTVDGLLTNEEVRTNISNTGDLSEQTGMLVNEHNAPVTAKELNDASKAVRIVGITIEIYPKNHTALDTAYAVVNTTKGE